MKPYYINAAEARIIAKQVKPTVMPYPWIGLDLRPEPKPEALTGKWIAPPLQLER